MELALLVYAIDVLDKLRSGAIAILFTAWVPLGFALVFWIDPHDDTEDVDTTKKWYRNKIMRPLVWIMLLSGLLILFTPKEKVLYTMLGAYAAQKVIESPEVRDMSNDVLIILTSKVKEYAAEAVKEAEEATKK